MKRVGHPTSVVCEALREGGVTAVKTGDRSKRVEKPDHPYVKVRSHKHGGGVWKTYVTTDQAWPDNFWTAVANMLVLYQDNVELDHVEGDTRTVMFTWPPV